MLGCLGAWRVFRVRFRSCFAIPIEFSRCYRFPSLKFRDERCSFCSSFQSSFRGHCVVLVRFRGWCGEGRSVDRIRR